MSNLKHVPAHVLVRVLLFWLFFTGVLYVSSALRAAAAGGRSAGASANAGSEEQENRPAARLSSGFIGVEVDMETGRLHFTGMEGGKPQDLLFFDEPPTSYVTIYTNGDAFVFGDHVGEFITRPVPANGGIESVWENDFLTVKERVELVKRADTGHEDGVLITYTVENRYGYAADVGLEALFDTYLGEKGLKHFELPGGLSVEYEAVFEKEALPEYWFSVDGENGSPCLMGVLKSGLVTLPDKLIFANYRALVDARFGYRVRRKKRFDLLPYSKNDSAVALVFGPVSIESGESLAFTMLLGLCGPGEYIMGDEVVEEGGEPGVREPIPAGEPVPQIGPDVDFGQLNSMLREINISRGSIKRINEYINRLNGLLGENTAGFEGDTLTAEELEALKRALSALSD